jgi:hypothetical protein
MRLFFLIAFLLISALAVSQDQAPSRGSIPEALLRPSRGEGARFPVDIVIGQLGRGSASHAAFFHANSIAVGLLSGRVEHPVLSSIDAVLRESYLSALSAINPQSYRIGGGRVEPDGAVSFLVRFIGSSQGITGELYIRYITRQIEGADGEVTTIGSWRFEELLLEEPKDLEVQTQEAIRRNDFYPYERFF